MKDRKTRVIIILVSCVLAVCVLIAARPVMRKGVELWRLLERYNTYDRLVLSKHSYYSSQALLPKEAPAAVILEVYADDADSRLMPSYNRCTIRDEAEVAALVQTVRDGAEEYRKVIYNEEYYAFEPLKYFIFVSPEGEYWPLKLVEEEHIDYSSSYVLGLPEGGWWRITDDCAETLLALFDQYPPRDFFDPATYAAVRAEHLASGETVDLTREQIKALLAAIEEAESHLNEQIRQYGALAREPEYVLRFRFTDGGEHLLGYRGDGPSRCDLVPISEQYRQWVDRRDNRYIWRYYHLPPEGLFEAEMDLEQWDRYYACTTGNDPFAPLLEELFGED